MSVNATASKPKSYFTLYARRIIPHYYGINKDEQRGGTFQSSGATKSAVIRETFSLFGHFARVSSCGFDYFYPLEAIK